MIVKISNWTKDTYTLQVFLGVLYLEVFAAPGISVLVFAGPDIPTPSLQTHVSQINR